MDLKNVMVLNQQTRSPNRPSLKYSSGGSGPLWKKNEAFCIPTSGGSGQYIVMNGTNTPVQSTKNIMENATQGTSEQLSLVKSQTLTYLLEDFLAKHFQSLENAKDLTTPEGLYFLKSLGFLPTKDPDILYLKTSKVYLVMTKAKLSRQYLGFSPTWGMSINGRFLTAKTSESPRTGKESSLSDILEENPDPKYFLSEKITAFLLNDRGKFPPQLRSDTTNKDSQTLISLLKNQRQGNRVYSKKGISPTIPTSVGGRHIPQVLED